MISWRAVSAAGWVLLLAGLAVMLFGPFWVGLGIWAGGALLRLRCWAEGHYRPQHGDKIGGDDDRAQP